MLVTRGDVDVAEIVAGLLAAGFYEVLVHDNGAGRVTIHPSAASFTALGDLAVYGRYAAIRWASRDVIYVQDDDCLLPPDSLGALLDAYRPGHVVCNMPEPWRVQSFYADHALVGFGAVFDRDLPQQAFLKLATAAANIWPWFEWFNRCCDVAFTALTPRVLVDVPYGNLPHATGPGRMYRQPGHVEERTRMLTLALEARDA